MIKPVRISTLQLGLSNRCNLQCRICIQQEEKFCSLPSAQMSDEVFSAVIDGLEEGLRPDSLHLFWNDEPTLHPCFAEWFEQLVKCVKQDKAGELIVSTNATHLEEMAETIGNSADARIKVILSLDAATAETYTRVRAGDFQKVKRGVEVLQQVRGHQPGPLLIYQMVLTPWNRGEIDFFIDSCQKLHAEATGITPMFTMERPDFNHDTIYVKCPFPWQDRDESELAREWFIQEARERGFYHAVHEACAVASPRSGRICSLMMDHLVIHPDGQVSPCCIDFDGRVQLGIINQNQNLLELHQSENAKWLRRMMREGRESELPDRCQNCLLPE